MNDAMSKVFKRLYYPIKRLGGGVPMVRNASTMRRLKQPRIVFAVMAALSAVSLRWAGLTK